MVRIIENAYGMLRDKDTKQSVKGHLFMVEYSDYAALEAQLAERGKANRETVAKHVYDAMSWAAVLGPDPATGTVPQWVDGGNSLGQDEARKTADAILSALEATPPAPKVTDEMVERALDVMRSATYAAIKSEEGKGLDIQKLNFIGMLAALTAAQEAGRP